MKALLRKEIRALLPLLVLVLLVCGSNIVFVPLTQRLDEAVWANLSDRETPGAALYHAYAFLILSLVAAYSAFPREHDEQTIEFLYALPISRGAIFFTKALAAASVVVVGIVVEQAIDGFLQAFNPQSFGGEQWRFDVVWGMTWMSSAFAGIIVCHGLLLSFLRRLGLILYVVLAYGVQTLSERFPALAYLKVTELVTFQYSGQTLVPPWRGFLFHGVLGLLALALAYSLWMGRGERVTYLYRQLESRTVGRFALGCTTLLTFVLVILASAWVLDLDEAGEEPAVSYQSFETVWAETIHYTFAYPANLGQPARRLIRTADAAYEAVAGALGARIEPRVSAQLSELTSVHAGLELGGAIRVALVRSGDDRRVVRTLHHETVHAFQHHLSDRRVYEHNASLRFFLEGLAEYLALELVPDEDLRRAQRRVAAAAWERHQIRFADLIDDERFRARYDGHLVYALGETFSQALVAACGKEILGGVLLALARDDAPEGLSGLDLWHDALRAAGCGLEPVLAAWGGEMERRVTEEHPFLDRLPWLGGGYVKTEEDELVFQAILDRSAPEEDLLYYLRLRRDADSGENEIRTLRAKLDHGTDHATFRVPRSWFRGGPFEFQLGQEIPNAKWPLYEPWQLASEAP